MRRLLISTLVSLSLTAAQGSDQPLIEIVESADTIAITRDKTPVLSYQKSILPPPPGTDPRYARSGFIHPVHAPSGAILTGIHPADHIHHIGLWHPWVNTSFRGHKVDFWNLKKGLGTVRYARTVQLTKSGFTVEQEHLDLTDPDSPEVVLREQFSVNVTSKDGANLIGYTTSQTNVTDAPLILPQYRYGGGIAYRAPANWDNSNSDYLSSEGKTRVDGHTTRSRWVAMFGPTGEGDSTLAILNHPSNHDHPQRMRVWPPSSANGAIFLNYCPVQEKPWKIAPGQTSVMRYQIATFDGRPKIDNLNVLWQVFADKNARSRR